MATGPGVLTLTPTVKCGTDSVVLDPIYLTVTEDGASGYNYTGLPSVSISAVDIEMTDYQGVTLGLGETYTGQFRVKVTLSDSSQFYALAQDVVGSSYYHTYGAIITSALSGDLMQISVDNDDNPMVGGIDVLISGVYINGVFIKANPNWIYGQTPIITWA